MHKSKTVCFAGDWHADREFALRAIQHAHDNGADTIAHLGDYGFTFRSNYIEDQTKLLEELDMNLYFIDGNHDDHDYLNGLPLASNGTRPLSDRIFHLPRGFRWKWGTKTFLALGGAVSVDKVDRRSGFTWWPQEEISYVDAKQAVTGGRVDVMLTHDCPSGVDVPLPPVQFPASYQQALLESQRHRMLLREIVDKIKPSLLLHGHMHVRYNDLLHGEKYITEVIGLDMNHNGLESNMLFWKVDNGEKEEAQADKPGN